VKDFGFQEHFLTLPHKLFLEKNMALTKTTKTDKIETVAVLDHYVLQCRNRISVMENGSELSSSFERYVLNPNADVSTISDLVVKAQFEAVMTKAVKDNYAKFLKEQAEQNKAS
jgi:hypothetical protein